MSAENNGADMNAGEIIQLVLVLGLALERLLKNVKHCECSRHGCAWTNQKRDPENPPDD